MAVGNLFERNKAMSTEKAPPKYPTFEELRAIDVSEHIEKKNGMSYLSWAWAVDTLLQKDPDAEWEHPEEKTFADGTMMVYAIVKAFGKTKKAQLPVMDYKNQAIKNPSSFQINTALQRCLVKTIALHGIGLYIYAGEDIPDNGEQKEIRQEEKAKPVKASFKGFKSSEERMDWLHGAAKEISLLKNPEEIIAWERANEPRMKSLGAKQIEWLEATLASQRQKTYLAPATQNNGEARAH
jgi:hypothetical protein